jgi:small GTP-binding protein
MNNRNTLKIVMAGESGVGKTTLVWVADGHPFADQVSTIGVDFVTFRGQLPIKTVILDTSGSEVFHSVTKLYFRYADCVVFVYDVLRPHTLKKIEDYWIKRVIETDEQKRIFVFVCNKTDLPEEQWKIRPEEGEKLAKEYNSLHFTVSSKNKMETKTVFLEAERLMYEARLEANIKKAEAGESSPGSLSSKTDAAKYGCC